MIYFGVTVVADDSMKQEYLARTIQETIDGKHSRNGKQLWPFKGNFAGLEKHIIPDGKCKFGNYNYVVVFHSSLLCFLYFKWSLRKYNDVYLFGRKYPSAIERSVSA